MSNMALVVKKLPAKAGDVGGSIPMTGRSPGEGNDNPLQYSCLENPVDRGAWRATVHEVAQSQTQLTDWAQHSVWGLNFPDQGSNPWLHRQIASWAPPLSLRSTDDCRSPIWSTVAALLSGVGRYTQYFLRGQLPVCGFAPCHKTSRMLLIQTQRGLHRGWWWDQGASHLREAGRPSDVTSNFGGTSRAVRREPLTSSLCLTSHVTGSSSVS